VVTGARAMGANIGEKGAETKVGERNNRLRRHGHRPSPPWAVWALAHKKYGPGLTKQE
jgi:hypothetical protein